MHFPCQQNAEINYVQTYWNREPRATFEDIKRKLSPEQQNKWPYSFNT
jgi:hypothetical protein